MSDDPYHLLHISNLRKRYSGRWVLDGVNLQLAHGARLALMGPSGSGKTTLLNCLGGIDRADQGTILFGGSEMGKLNDDALAALRRQRIGTVFQFFHLLPTLNAWENVELPLLLNRVSAAERRNRVAKLLDEVGVTHRADALPAELSGGEQQRVAIARALATRPLLLLADEPTGNLDSRTGAMILDLLENLCQQHQTALVMVTHDAATTRICHKVVHMLDGKIADNPQNAL